jgi:AraC-like DNA-binding protein
VTLTFTDKLQEFDRSARRGTCVAAVPTAPDNRIAKPPSDAADRLALAMAYLREHFLDAHVTNEMARVAGMPRSRFQHVFLKAHGRMPARARAELQIELVKSLLKQGAVAQTVYERTGFCNRAAMSAAFKIVTGQTCQEWLSAARKANPAIPGRTRRPAKADSDDAAPPDLKQTGWKQGAPANYRQERDRKDRDAATLAAHRPASSGPKPTAEDLRGSAAFDAHQQRLATERSAVPVEPALLPHHRETRPRRATVEGLKPINPSLIAAVDTTATVATCFDRFVRDKSKRLNERHMIADDGGGA